MLRLQRIRVLVMYMPCTHFRDLRFRCYNSAVFFQGKKGVKYIVFGLYAYNLLLFLFLLWFVSPIPLLCVAERQRSMQAS